MNSRLVVLAIGSFVLGTNTLILAGLLPVVAESLETSQSVVGLTQSAFSITYAVAALSSPILLARFDRRAIMIAVVAVFIVSVVVAGSAQDVATFTVARVVSALASGVFPAQAMAVAMLIVTEEFRARAMAVIYAGAMSAMAAGVPIGALIADMVSYRVAFYAMAAFAIIPLAGLFLVPRTPRPPRATFRAQLEPLANPTVLAIASVSALFVAGQFTIIIYLAPLLDFTASMDTTTVAIVLVGFGGTGIVGMVFASRFIDRYGGLHSALVIFSLLVILTPLISLASTLLLALLILIPWSILQNSAVPATQYEMGRLYPENPAPVFGINSAGFNVGGALAGLIGAAVLDAGGAGWLPAAALVPTAAALIGAVILATRRKPRALG